MCIWINNYMKMLLTVTDFWVAFSPSVILLAMRVLLNNSIIYKYLVPTIKLVTLFPFSISKRIIFLFSQMKPTKDFRTWTTSFYCHQCCFIYILALQLLYSIWITSHFYFTTHSHCFVFFLFSNQLLNKHYLVLDEA